MKLNTISRILTLTLLLYVHTEALEIDDIDYDLDQFKKLHTDKFYTHEEVMCKVIVRRGADFKFTVKLNEDSSNVKIKVQMLFDTPLDRLFFELPSNGWNMTQTTSGKKIDVVVHIPGNASVGAWYIYLTVEQDGNDVEFYQVPQELVVLFNPWSSEDAVYYPVASELNEYVLSEVGYVYFYNWEYYYSRPWIFAQFNPKVLEALLFILNQMQLTANDRGDIVKVARTMTHMLNYYGTDHPGVLIGKWKEPYEGELYGFPTISPMKWTGSADIFIQYYTSGGVPVGYGQCWVFAGILTTAYRALGVASRPVGNIISAHDNDKDLRADTYLHQNGSINLAISDTLWNFHEWVEAWFRRDDLGMTQGEWQELDATPQGFNDGRMQVGPASISHIYNANVLSNYETLYLYSEVNSDEVVYDFQNHIVRVNQTKVGWSVKTKDVNRDGTVDITWRFKPPEGTPKERELYNKAAAAINRTPVTLTTAYSASKLSDEISITLSKMNHIHVGQPIRVEILLRNHNVEPVKLTLSVTASSVYYNGKLKSEIKNKALKFTLKGLQTKKIVFKIETKDYITKLADQRTIIVEASAINGNNIHHVVERFNLHSPKLEIKAPSIVKRNSAFNVSEFPKPFDADFDKLHTNCRRKRIQT